MKHFSRAEKDRLFSTYRLEARKLLKIELSQSLESMNVDLSDIDEEGLKQAESWSAKRTSSQQKFPRWSWRKELDAHRRKPRRVELAIWVKPELCGLLLGRISSHRVVASIYLLEGNPNVNHPLSGQVATIGIRFLELLGVIAGCKRTAIHKPVDELIEMYKGHGYTNEELKGKRVIRLTKTL